MRIARSDQIDLPFTRPVLDILLALERSGDRVMRLEIDQRLDAVPLGKAVREAFALFVDAAYQIGANANIDRSTGLARENVNPVGHLSKMMDCRVKPGNDGWRGGRKITPASAPARGARLWNPCPGPAPASRGRRA